MAMSKNLDEYLDSGMKGWIFNTAKSNYGRIANYDLADLTQEGYMCYYKCRARYVGKEGLVKRDGTPCRVMPEIPDKEARRHFQSLVKTAFSNHLSTLALKQPKGWELAISSIAKPEQTAEQAWDTILPAEGEVATVGILLKSAPNEIKQLFQLLVNDAIDLSGYRRFGKKRTAHRETTNQRFCRLLNLAPDYDLVGQVEQHFLR